jgi:hypothetical protein
MSIRAVNITLDQDTSGKYVVDVSRFVRNTSARSFDQVIWTFAVIFFGAEHPSPANARVIFEDSPFLNDFTGEFIVWETAPHVSNIVRNDSVGPGEQDSESYKYTIIVTDPDGGTITLPPLDPNVLVRRRRLFPYEI